MSEEMGFSFLPSGAPKSLGGVRLNLVRGEWMNGTFRCCPAVIKRVSGGPFVFGRTVGVPVITLESVSLSSVCMPARAAYLTGNFPEFLQKK